MNSTTRQIIHCACATVILFSVMSCDRGAPSEDSSEPLSPPPAREVVVYVSTDEAIARPILEAFTQESGIAVRARYDSENAKTTALAAMLRTEHDAPRADVFWSGECFASTELGREGVIAPWRCMRSGELPDSLRGESGWWHGFAPRMRVLVYDPRRTTVEQLPQSMLDLATPAFGKSVAMADPRFGTTRCHIGAFASQMEWREVGSFQKWVDGFASNKPLMLAGGNAAVVDAVIHKEVDFGLTDSDDVYAAVANGAVLAMIPLRQFPSGESGGGPMLIPNSVSLVNGAPHPAEANALMIFLLQPKVTEWLHASRSGNFIIQLNPPTNVSRKSIPDSSNSALPPSAPPPSAPPPSSPPDGLSLMPEIVQSIRIQVAEDPFQFDQQAAISSIDESLGILRKACTKDGTN